MRVDEFDYDLPEDRIAQFPVTPRDASRLMVVRTGGGPVEHRTFRDIVEYVNPGDALVVNDSRVIPARLFGRKADSGGTVELLLLHPVGTDRWEALIKPGRRVKRGTRLTFGDGVLTGVVDGETEDGSRVVQFGGELAVAEALDRLGEIPLPPYIKNNLDDPERYQTVYAEEPGSVAAPTAGLHFTPALLSQIVEMGIEVVPLTLHVGVGTFRPVTADRVEEHRMHEEAYRLSDRAAARLNAVHRAGGRVVAVGTTTTRVLESSADADGACHPGEGWTRLFIKPGYRFRAVDALITNFHLPKSTLLMLVSAFAGTERIRQAYGTAVRERYRFYSLGDAMLLV